MSRIDSQSGVRIDQLTATRIDTNPNPELLIVAAQAALGTVTRSNTLLTSVTTTRAFGSQIARSNALVSSVSTTRTFENQITA